MKLTLTEAGELFGVSRQAIVVAIRRGFIPAARNGPNKKKIYVEKKDVQHYRENRWDRKHNFEKNELSPHMAAEVIGCPVQRVYHLMRIHKLPFWHKAKKIITIEYKDALKLKEPEAIRMSRKRANKFLRETTRQELPRRIIRKTNKPI